MATRSAIGYVLPDGRIKASYCHWDGYPDHQLPILTKHYTETSAVMALVDGGSMSQLRTRDTWDNSAVLQDEQGLFIRDDEGLLRFEIEQEPGPLYHADRGDGMQPVISNYPTNCWDALMDIEHLYVFYPELQYWQHVEQNPE